MTEIINARESAAEKEIEELRERVGQLEALTEEVPGGMRRCACDKGQTILQVSNSFLKLVGYTRKELEERFHHHFVEMVYLDDRLRIREEMEEQLLNGADLMLEYRLMRGDGQLLWILDQGKCVVSPKGEKTFCCMLMDMTKQREERDRLRLSLEQYQIILDQTTDIIFEWDISRDTIEFSRNWYKKFGYEPICDLVSERIPQSPNLYPDDIPSLLKIKKAIISGAPYFETELRIKDAMGRFIWNRVRLTVQYDKKNKPVKAEGIIVDIDADKKQKQLLLERAQHDALTNLYNKAALEELVTRRMMESGTGKEQALLIIDVDHFKRVNDKYGHLCGDSLLSDVAGVLKSRFRSSDLVGRIGGDEFLVYLPEIANRTETTKRADAVLKALQMLRPEEAAQPITCSIGIAQFPQRAIDYYALYKCADLALYQMKAQGKNGFLFYDPTVCEGRIPCGLAKSAIGAIDSEREELGDEVGEKLAQYTFQMLYESVDVKTAAGKLLEIVGRAYDVSRAYIFESSEDGESCSNTFEWCNTYVPSELDNMKNLSYREDLGDYLQNFNEDGLFYCTEVQKLHPKVQALLARQGVCSFLQCAIREDGIFRGFVGFEECKENRFWTKSQMDSLTLIAHVLSTFLLKFRLKEQLSRHKEKLGLDKACPKLDLD